MQTLTMNDGTVLTGSYAIQDGNTLWLYMKDEYEIGQLFDLLYDSETNSKITANEFGSIKVYEGYSELFCIRKETDTFFTAGLRK